MPSDLNGFEIPYIINAPKSVEEKIEEARRSGYINSNNPNDINSNREQLCCRACGSLKVSPGTPIYLDDAKGVEIPYPEYEDIKSLSEALLSISKNYLYHQKYLQYQILI